MSEIRPGFEVFTTTDITFGCVVCPNERRLHAKGLGGMAALCYLREPEVAFVPYAVEERVNISYLGEKVPSNINAISYARVGDSSCDNDCGFKEKIIEVEQGLIDSLEQVVGAGNVESR